MQKNSKNCIQKHVYIIQRNTVEKELKDFKNYKLSTDR